MQLKGKRGVIHHIKDNGDLLVVYSGNGFVINPAAVVKVSIIHNGGTQALHITRYVRVCV